MIITEATLDALRTTFGLQFAAAFEGTPTWFDKLCTTIPSSTKSNTYGFLANSIALREWVGPRVSQNLSEHKYVLENKKYEGTVELQREDIEDDNLGVFTAMTIPGLAEATRKHPDHLLASVLSANPTGYDGKAFFATDHPNYNRSGSGDTTFDNAITGTALTGDGFAAVRAKMASRIGENGLPLAVQPRLLIVPPQLEREALVIMQSTTYAIPGTATTTAATVDNPLRGMADVLVVPELANAPTVWYLADVSRSIKPFVYQARDASELVARQNPEDPKVFDRDTFTYGVRVRHNIGVTLPHLITRVTT